MLYLWQPIHFGYRPPTSEIHDGIKSIHMKVGTLGIYHVGV
jgi:hypothetical protein